MDIPRIFTVSESEHRIHNPFTPEKYATLGCVLRMPPESHVRWTREYFGWGVFALMQR